MAVTKNALIRYQILDKCFRNSGRMFFWEDLLEECNAALSTLNPDSDGIQRRQIFNDIRFMESEQGWSIPLGRYRFQKKTYYRYEDLSFSINQQPLLDIEAEEIKSALQILSRFSGTPQFEWVNEMIPKLETKFGLKTKEQEFISFEENVDLKGRDFIPVLFKAIDNERVLNVTYKDFKNPEPYIIIFHPYYLKQYNNRWFVFGLNQEYEISSWNLALDRIQSITETNLSYTATDINWFDFFYDIIGVTRPIDAKVENIELRFDSKLAPYIITKPIHPTQKDSFEDSSLSIKIEVVPNYELEKLILSFGAGIEVIKPSWLREKIKGMHNEALVLYDS